MVGRLVSNGADYSPAPTAFRCQSATANGRPGGGRVSHRGCRAPLAAEPPRRQERPCRLLPESEMATYAQKDRMKGGANPRDRAFVEPKMVLVQPLAIAKELC